MTSKRKASDQLFGTDVEAKKPRVTTSGAISPLVPMEERKMAKKGFKDPQMLRMLCHDNEKKERKELHFKKIVHADIDWDNKAHIDKINAWRNQIYGRAGIKNKIVVMWHKDEESWIELYWQLLVVEANKRDIQLPKPKPIREDFNAFFNGKAFHSAGGEKLEPRVDRENGPFTSKMGRLVKPLRSYLEEKLRGKRGNSFYPKITQKMLSEYQKLKVDLAELGCEDTKIIPWEVIGDELNSKNYLVRCREYLASLPDQKDVEMDDPEEEEDMDVTLVGSEEFDKELLELATEPEGTTMEHVDTDEEPSSATPATNPNIPVRKASLQIILQKLPAVSEDAVISRKKRADSVALSITAAKESSSEPTLVEEEAIADKVKDYTIIGTEGKVVEGKANATAEDEAAATLLSLCGP